MVPNIFLHFDSSRNRPKIKIKHRFPMHLDKRNAQLGTKHGVHCRLTMGLLIGTTCLYSNFGLDSCLAQWPGELSDCKALQDLGFRGL